MTTARHGLHSANKYPLGDLEKLLDNFWTHANLTGDFEVMVSKYCKGTKYVKKISVLEDKISRIILKVKVGNDACFLIVLTVPPEFSGKSNELFERLRSAAEGY